MRASSAVIVQGLCAMMCAITAGCGTDAAVPFVEKADDASAQDASGDVAQSADVGVAVAKDTALTADLATEPDDIASEDTGPPEPFVPAKHTAIPPLGYFDGPVLASPKIVTVTFVGDTFAKDLQAFAAGLGKSAWWDAMRDGYCELPGVATCVGLAQDSTIVEFPFAPAAAYTDSTDGSASSIQTFIKAQVTSGLLPPPIKDILYVIYFPQKTKITLASGGGGPVDRSCKEFGAYHNHMVLNGQDTAYAIVPECAPSPFGDMDKLQTATVSSSHEIAEAVTDPFSKIAKNNTYVGGYRMLGQSKAEFPWVKAQRAGENADMCQDILYAGRDQVLSDGFTVQRVWSNKSAAAGHDPCVPNPAGQPYFNVAPANGKSLQKLSVGQSVTFNATAFSDLYMAGGWTVTGGDSTSYISSQYPAFLDITINGKQEETVQNGDVVEISVTLKGDPSKYQFGASGLLVSKSLNGKLQNIWPIFVYTPAEAKYIP